MTGKNFCNKEKKWCKFLKRNICIKGSDNISNIVKCPRIKEIETIKLYELIKTSSFDEVFSRLVHWYPDQEKNKNGYEKVFNTLNNIEPKKTYNLNNLFIKVEIVVEDGKEYIDAYGVKPNNKQRYGLEFESWKEIISMFIFQESIDKLSKEDIIAACLYEITFFGFDENKIQSKWQELNNMKYYK